MRWRKEITDRNPTPATRVASVDPVHQHYRYKKDAHSNVEFVKN